VLPDEPFLDGEPIPERVHSMRNARHALCGLFSPKLGHEIV
jgi:hypothetical protein